MSLLGFGHARIGYGISFYRAFLRTYFRPRLRSRQVLSAALSWAGFSTVRTIMCQPASFVITKDRVFWSLRTDSHSAIITEYELHEHGSHGPKIVKVEITPPDGDYTRPLTEWVYKVDQDILPDWHDNADTESRSRDALDEWAAKRLLLSGHHVVEAGNHVFIYGSASAELYDSASATLFGSASAELFGSASAELYDHSTAHWYSSAERPVPSGPYAVVIDRTGDRAVCITNQ